MNKYPESRELARKFYGDGKMHSIKEVRAMLADHGIVEKKNGNMISNVLYQLKKEGYIRMCEEKGFYILAEAHTKGEHEAHKEHEEPEGTTVMQEEKREERKLNVDMNRFILIKPQSPRHTELKATVLEAGEIRLNAALQKQIGTRKIQILLSRDSRTLLLHGAGEKDADAMEFTKAGTAKNREIVDILKGLKIAFPITYDVKWNEGYGAWEGTLQISAKK